MSRLKVVRQVVTSLGAMLFAPVRMRRNPPTAPSGPEHCRLNLYLNGKRLVVTRYLDGDDLVWRWGPYTNRLRRLGAPVTAAPA